MKSSNTKLRFSPSRTRWLQLTFRTSRIPTIVFVMLVCVPSYYAQTFRGTILGTVTDPNGAVVPDANVTARNIATGIERTTKTDGVGNYTLAELQTGTYE